MKSKLNQIADKAIAEAKMERKMPLKKHIAHEKAELKQCPNCGHELDAGQDKDMSLDGASKHGGEL